jgi:hypothetical protein
MWPYAQMSQHDTRTLRQTRLEKDHGRNRAEDHYPRNHEYVTSQTDSRREMIEQIAEMMADTRVMGRKGTVLRPEAGQKKDIIVI